MTRSLNPERKAALLNAALKLFAERGIVNALTADIAREAGVAAGTLFLYFPTKQALVNELALQLAYEQAERVAAHLSPQLSARETFWAVWSATLDWFLERPYTFEATQQLRDPVWITPETLAESQRAFAYYYAAIQKGQAEGVLAPYPPELIGGMLYQGMVAVMLLLRQTPDPVQQAALIRQGFEMFWGGAAAASPSTSRTQKEQG